MQLLECKGTPFEIGRQQGDTLRELIRERWETDVGPMLERMRKENPDVDARIAKVHERCVAFLQSNAPDLLDEIRGLAEGAKLAFDRALWMSTYNSIAMCLGDSRFRADGCSALAFARTPSGPMVFKTYDPFGAKKIDTSAKRRARAEAENRWLYALRAEYAHGHSHLGIRIAGSIWTECAVTNDGLAFSCASLHPRLYPQTAHALPQHFLGTFAITRCRTTAEVRALFAKTPVFGKGQALAYVDASGDCCGFEKTASFTGMNEAESGVAYQTNHLRAPNMVQVGREQDPKFWEGKYHDNSNSRVERIRQHLPRWKSAPTTGAIIDDLFHAGGRGDLIQDCTEKNHYWITTWGALVFPQTKELWVAEGLPEERQFQMFKL